MVAVPGLVIVSGGQSGVDRAALDAALALAIPYAGFCPRGGWAEDLPQPPGLLARYPLLRETPLADPAQRTEWNVRASDALMILVPGAGGLAASPGTTLAHEIAMREGKPVLVVPLDDPDAAVRATHWLDGVLSAWREAAPLKLGIGGPRESEAGGIYDSALALLRDVLRAK
jgi:hypothetical protein